jgi:biopolymer transport protein ExbB
MREALELLQQGGWPMIPLAILSVVGVTIVIERALALRRRSVIAPGIVRLAQSFESEAAAESAIIACQRANGAFARIVEQVIRDRHLEHAQALERMRAVGRTQLGRLERGLTLLEIVAAVSPLIGLLGTVLGMVTIFNAITAQGLGNPQVLSDGISKALITTVAGLSVAIPALAFHSLLSKRVDELATEMQDYATAFIIRLQGLK